jgi:hypothetical protein
LHDKDKILQLHFARLEVMSQLAVDSLITGDSGLREGPCIVRHAAGLRSEVAPLIDTQVASLPSYVDELKTFVSDTESSLDHMQSPSSPKVNHRIWNKKESTPVRSNKSIPEHASPGLSHKQESGSASASATKILNFQYLLQEGRNRMRQSDPQLPALNDLLIGREAPPKEAHRPELIPDAKDASPSIQATAQQSIASRTIPGEESFFEDHSKGIPSPIKQDEEWSWADEW